MVERLKQAIEKARREREGALSADAPTPAARADRGTTDDAWSMLRDFSPAPSSLRDARIVTADKGDAAYIPFDLMRTRILKTCAERRWRRIGVTSATKHCGKTFVSLNLAYSIARNPNVRCTLVDVDLKKPSLRATLAGPSGPSFPDFLAGRATLEETAWRLLPNLAAFFGGVAADSAELIQSPDAARALREIEDRLNPDIVIFDMPPVFASDDVLSLVAALDAVLIVAAAGRTTAKDITDAENLIGGGAAFLGVVLNMVNPDDAALDRYDYGGAVS